MKLSKADLRRLIAEEIKSMGEDVIVPKSAAASRSTPPLNKSSTCEQCGGSMYEGECDECGKMMYESVLAEGDCGCHDGTDYSIDTMSKIDSLDYEGIVRKLLGMHQPSHDHVSPGEAAGIGYNIGKHHHSGAYMAKSQMYKVSKYASKLYHMIPDGHNLEDWMRTKLAQISDDISEVYHALEHDIYEGDV